MAVHRLQDASQDRIESLLSEGSIEVGNREVVGHAELSGVGENDVYVPATVLMAPGRHNAPCDFRQMWGNLDADHLSEGPLCCLMNHPALPAAEVHEGSTL